MPVDLKTLQEIALTESEYAVLEERLGREPNSVELGIAALLWSEHCGYKHSKPLLRLFSARGPQVLIGAGEENAGAVDIGDGLAIIMKVESHNHPSALEPYEGAATGVGGIVRDIFSMGARPIALLNALFFGPLTEPRNRYLFDGVVSGIGGYGNCLGIPDVGGQLTFAPAYSRNPLVNAMCVGIARHEDIILAQTGGAGNVLMLVGADTGRDGIHGATFASVELDEASEERRSAVQVGNPFLEKLLLEACLEVAQEKLLVGMQDLGAGGLTSAAIECAANGGMGIELDVALVPRREEAMTAYEVMLSESQERMLMVIHPDNVARVQAIFDRWDLHSVVIGRVTDDGQARILDNGVVVADAPVEIITDPPLYTLEGVEDPRIVQARESDVSTLPEGDLNAALLTLLGSPNIGNRRSVFQQYDHQVLNNTVVPPGADASVLRIKGTRKGIALKADTNGRYCWLDPFQGGAIAVAEAARNLACMGAKPLALTNCLNFANPEKPEIYYQLEQCVRGMAQASESFGVPVISGNVSLYNESEDGPIYPTPLVGMLGLLDDVEQRCTPEFKSEGDVVYLVGTDALAQDTATLGGSEYLALVHGTAQGAPTIDLTLEIRVQDFVRQAIERGLLRSAHDVSDGGLAVTVAESCIWGGLGLHGAATANVGRGDAALFGEAQSRIVVSVSAADTAQFEADADGSGVPYFSLGTVQGESLSLPGLAEVTVADMAKAWNGALA